MAKAKKTRAKTYDAKLSISGTFEDVIGLSVGKKPIPKKVAKKSNTKK